MPPRLAADVALAAGDAAASDFLVQAPAARSMAPATRKIPALRAVVVRTGYSRTQADRIRKS
jgi:hypothetical protein